MSLEKILKTKLKNTRYLLEALIVKLGVLFFYSLKAQKASNLAARAAIFIGQKISVNKLAYRNLSNALPDLSGTEKNKILHDMWDNLGRIIGEYPHISHAKPDQITKIIGCSDETKNVIEKLKNDKKGGIIFSGHIGNWEVGPKFFMNFGLKVHTVYRPLNNPYVEKITANIRGSSLIAKGSQGNRKIIELLKRGEFIIILADQKISDGEPIKFFHDYAITTTSIARIALKYNVPLIPARAIRLDKKFQFLIEVEKPLEIVASGNLNEDSINLTTKINNKLESWIKEYPAQWFWVHNRWKK